jgi:RimJ/RimL family protein N-acetyltransferase
MTIRLLGPGDEAALDAFLERHRDSSMILRSNVRLSGLEYRPAAFHGQYMAAFRGAEVVAVIAHAWNGMLIAQSPEQAGDVANTLLALSARRVHGLLGPREHVAAVSDALGLSEAPTQTRRDEILFGLELARLAPPKLGESLEFRRFVPEDRATLIDWRVAYDIETMSGRDTPEARAAAAGWFDWQLAEGTARVATMGNVLVSMAAFSSSLPDMVQLGGIYTPPALRRRHFARATISAALLAARSAGVGRAVLFASDSSAIRCYEALGFTQAGEFGLVLFE